MVDEYPDPPVPVDADCRQLAGFMLNVERLLASELWALSTGDEFKAALGLWSYAWKQVPAGSLPNDDRVLAAFSGAGKRWPKVKAMALRGFVRCSDGRLYHPVLCEDVLRGLAGQKRYRDRREADAKRLREWRERQARNGNETRFDDVPKQPGNADEMARDRDRDRDRDSLEGSKEPNGSSGATSAPRDPVGELFNLAEELFGPKGRALAGKARKEFGDIGVMNALIACRDEAPSDPVPFFIKCLEARKQSNGRRSAHADETAAFDAITRR